MSCGKLGGKTGKSNLLGYDDDGIRVAVLYRAAHSGVKIPDLTITGPTRRTQHEFWTAAGATDISGQRAVLPAWRDSERNG